MEGLSPHYKVEHTDYRSFVVNNATNDTVCDVPRYNHAIAEKIAEGLNLLEALAKHPFTGAERPHTSLPWEAEELNIYSPTDRHFVASGSSADGYGDHDPLLHARVKKDMAFITALANAFWKDAQEKQALIESLTK